MRFSLTVNPGSGQGLYPAPGYPVDIAGRPGNRVYAENYPRGGLGRIFLTRDHQALAVDPADRTVYEYDAGGSHWLIPAEGLKPRSPEEASAWVVTTQGRVTLVNGNMAAARGFPLATGLRLSAPPAARGGKLYLSDEEGKVHTVDARAAQGVWDLKFPAALRSPPVFLDLGDRLFAGVYPKRFLGDIWVLDGDGNTLPNWPAPVDAIAFGSPLLFGTDAGALHAAFVTQAGELSVFNEYAEPLPGFPLELPGVFYLQPVWNGEALWLVSEQGVLYQVNLEGQALRQQIPGLSVKEEGYLAAVDVDKDGRGEIFFSGEGNALYGYSGNFRSLDGFPLPVWGRPSFLDLNGDGKSECTGAGMDNRLYRWHFR
jgi:outer membrane protein assembly factor BamB